MKQSMVNQNIEEIFAENKKEVLGKIRGFRSNLEELNRMQNALDGTNTEIKSIGYFEDFDLVPDQMVKIKDLYFVIKQNGEKIEYEIYAADVNHLIVVLDKEGNITFLNEGLQEFEKSLTLNGVQSQEDKMKAISRTLTEEELEEDLSKEEPEEDLNDTIEEEKEVSNDLGIEVKNIKRIRESELTDEFYKDFPNLRDLDDVKVGYSIKDGRSVLIYKNEDGKNELVLDSASKAEFSQSKVIVINQDKTVDEQYMKTLMPAGKNGHYIGAMDNDPQSGYIDYYTVRKDPSTGRLVANPLSVIGRDISPREITENTKDISETEQIADNFEQKQEEGRNDVNFDELMDTSIDDSQNIIQIKEDIIGQATDKIVEEECTRDELIRVCKRTSRFTTRWQRRT